MRPLLVTLVFAVGCESVVTDAKPDFDGEDAPVENSADGVDGGRDCSTVALPEDQPRRLNLQELNTIAMDVLGAPAGSFSMLGTDYGQRVGSALGATETWVSDLLDASMAVSQRYFQDNPPACDGAGCARSILAPLARRLFRRPVPEEKLDRLSAFATEATAAGLTLTEGLEAALAAIFVSPDFLIIGTRVEATSGTYALDDYEISERLALALWNSVPDEALLQAAERGELHTAEQIAAAGERMLADPDKGARFLDGFVEANFDLPSGAATPIGLEGNGGAALAELLKTEATLVLHRMFEEDRPLTDMVNGGDTFINAELAEYYGVPGVEGDAFVPADLSATGRTSGLLTSGAVLAQEVDLIHRGLNVMQTFLCRELVAPDPAIIEAGLAEIPADATVREQVDYRVTAEACMSCHRAIDSLGAAFERYDASGRARDTYPDGDSTDYTLEFAGRTISSPADVSDYATQERMVSCMSSKALGWLSFRYLSLSSAVEQCAAASVVAAAPETIGFRSMFVAALKSPTFRTRVVGE